MPASAYCARFIGQTNLLSCVVRDGVADSGAFAWRHSGEPGRALFSLRPECIALAGIANTGRLRFRARVSSQIFQGATALLQIECANGQLLSVRIPGGKELQGDHEFEFAVSDAIRLEREEAN